MTRGLRAAALTVSLALGLTLAAAPNSHAATTHHSVAQAEAYLKGKYYGPTAYSSFGRATITAWSSYVNCTNHKTYYTAKLAMKQYSNPMMLTNGADSTVNRSDLVVVPDTITPLATCGLGVTPDVTANSWYNPFSWDWGHILGSIWNNIASKCASGAASGLVGTASGAVAVNLFLKGGKIFVGPEGYAAIAIGGCIVNMLF